MQRFHAVSRGNHEYPSSQLPRMANAATKFRTELRVTIMPDPLLEVRNLEMYFAVRSGLLMRAKAYNKAVDNVSLTIHPGETLGLVGESGCGKSTLGRCILKLYAPNSGQVLFENSNITKLSSEGIMEYRKSVQMIFQDPMESLNSRHTVNEILTEPFLIHNIGDREWRYKKVRNLLDIVGLPANAGRRYPFEFSGGQRQRIGIARAIALKPKLIVCDEAVSALDVSIQGQIVNLLLDLQTEFNLSYLFIAHDLAIVKHISDRIAVMYLGKIVELATSKTIYEKPKHPYTKLLIDSIPVPDPRQKREINLLQEDLPSSIDRPGGCAFHPRCSNALEKCQKISPKIRHFSYQHQYSCHLD